MSENELEWVVARKSDLSKCIATVSDNKTGKIYEFRDSTFKGLFNQLTKRPNGTSITVIDMSIDYQRFMEVNNDLF